MVNDSQREPVEKRRRCAQCSKFFTPKNYWQKYCGNACKQIDFWKRKRAKSSK